MTLSMSALNECRIGFPLERVPLIEHTCHEPRDDTA
jgi:hypothetical protein